MKKVLIGLLLLPSLAWGGWSTVAPKGDEPGDHVRIVSDKDFYTQVANGEIAGYSIVHKFGSADDIGTTLTVIATAKTYATPTSVTALELVSDDNTNDKAGQAGAQKVKIEGLCAGWIQCSEEVTLNGTTAVATTNSYFRVFRMYVTQSGTYATAAAASHNSTLTLRVASAGATLATIAKDGTFGLGQSQIAAYTIPDGYTGYILSGHATVETGKSVTLYFFKRCGADDVSAPYTGVMRVVDETRGLANGTLHERNSPQNGFDGPCDIGYMAKAGAGTTSDIEVDFEILLIQDGY